MTVVAYLKVMKGQMDQTLEQNIIEEWCQMCGWVCYPCDDVYAMEKAITNYPDHRIIALDPNGHKNFKEYAPAEHDIILLGRDNGGFCGFPIELPTAYKVTTFAKPREWHTISIMALILGKRIL